MSVLLEVQKNVSFIRVVLNYKKKRYLLKNIQRGVKKDVAQSSSLYTNGQGEAINSPEFFIACISVFGRS